MKSEKTPSQDAIAPGQTIELSTRFGNCSRGKCWGKYYADQTRAKGDFEWVDKSGGTLYLTGPGYYVVGSGDGFSREARGQFHLGVMVPYAECGPIEKLRRQREKLALHLAKDQDGIVTLVDDVLGFARGSQIRRGDLVAARQAEIVRLEAEISGVVSAHVDQATM